MRGGQGQKHRAKQNVFPHGGYVIKSSTVVQYFLVISSGKQNVLEKLEKAKRQFLLRAC